MTRKAIRDILKKIYSQEIMWYEIDAINAACEELKSGKWECDENGDWHCSVCKAIVERDEQTTHYWKYCYHCGAEMESDN